MRLERLRYEIKNARYRIRTHWTRKQRLALYAASVSLIIIISIALITPLLGSRSKPSITSLSMGETVGVIHDGKHITNCSIGPLISSDIGEGFLLAGHCGGAGDGVVQENNGSIKPVGTIYDSTQDVRTGHYEDAAVVYYTSDIRVKSTLGKGASPFRTISVDELLSRKQDSRMKLCADGASSGTRCGDFDGISRSTGLVVADFPSIGGDSGGPAYISLNGESEMLGIVVRSFKTTAGGSGTLIAPLDKVLENHPGLHVILGT